ncbi:MAG: thermopsin, partial [Thermoplasmata archaeon]|nr:thermopsin [Thermoplasmata archaeon]
MSASRASRGVGRLLVVAVVLVALGALAPSAGFLGAANLGHGAPVAPLPAHSLGGGLGPSERALASISAAHVPSRDVYLPNFHGGGKLAKGTVAPLFSTAPAPMGVADFGLIRNGTGVTVG